MNSLQQIGAETKGILGVGFLIFIYIPFVLLKKLTQLFVFEPVVFVFCILVALNLFYFLS